MPQRAIEDCEHAPHGPGLSAAFITECPRQHQHTTCRVAAEGEISPVGELREGPRLPSRQGLTGLQSWLCRFPAGAVDAFEFIVNIGSRVERQPAPQTL